MSLFGRWFTEKELADSFGEEGARNFVKSAKADGRMKICEDSGVPLHKRRIEEEVAVASKKRRAT